jgi:hypothetical protein
MIYYELHLEPQGQSAAEDLILCRSVCETQVRKELFRSIHALGKQGYHDANDRKKECSSSEFHVLVDISGRELHLYVKPAFV